MPIKILEAGKNEMGFVLSPSYRWDEATARAEIQRGSPSQGSRKNRDASLKGQEIQGPYARPTTILVFSPFIVQSGIWRLSALSAGEKAPLPRPRWNDNENRFRSQPCKRERSASLKFNPATSSNPEV